MKKQTRAKEFSPRERQAIHIRDRDRCIFCEKNYRMEHITYMGKLNKQIMHYIPRSKGGLGIAKNGAVGCLYHHQMLDNGTHREEMMQIFREHLMSFYSDWNEQELIYDKWKGVRG